MTRHLIAGFAAVMLLAAPAIALAADDAATYSDTKPKKAAAHKPAPKAHKAKAKAKKAAPAKS